MSEKLHLSNLHCHTTFSDGANSPEEMAEAAIGLGLSAIGFSDHSHTPTDSLYCITAENVPLYKRAIREVQQQFAGRIEVALGLEQDAMTVLDDRDDYDYILGDSHYVTGGGRLWHVDHDAAEQRESINEGFGGSWLSYAKEYFREYVEGVTRMKPDILGHFDLVTKFGLIDECDPAYQAAAVEALHAALAVTPVIEMNTGAISRGYRKLPYPADFLLKEIKKAGGEITLCSDSHAVHTQTCFFPESLDILRAAGFDHMIVWKNGGLNEVGIR